MGFNVINYNGSLEKMEAYDIFPYLLDKFKRSKLKCETFEDYKTFILDVSKYQWRYRCEYEILLSDWPCDKYKEKWDIHKQVEMNIDVITKLFMEKVIKNNK